MSLTSLPFLYRSHLTHKCDESVVREIITEAVTIEQEFVCEALSVRDPTSFASITSRLSVFACKRPCSCGSPELARSLCQVDLVGMNATLMRDYINYVADHLMVSNLLCISPVKII
jgi:hypothetical protein